MPKLSIVIPSRDERFLIPTIDDIFRKAHSDDTEVIAVLDSDKWPENWKAVTDRHPRLHTVYHGQPRGMRAAINSGVASAISRGAKFIAKFDGHCSFSEGFDEVLKAECEPNWIVVPRRGRLDPENWCETELHKPPIDYHYLSFPDDPNDFGGPGLNGKVWNERAVERKDILLDEEMSSQGSGWFMHASYFTELELMDEANYGPFWSEFQELGLKCWLSGGKVMVNKKCKYLHLHKGKTYGRGYYLPESWLKQGRNHVMLWPFNEAWSKQTISFEWLIDHFWPVPGWPENWRDILYSERKPRSLVPVAVEHVDLRGPRPETQTWMSNGLQIHLAFYGLGPGEQLNVTERVASLVKDDALDIRVDNSTLAPGKNPYRGKKKRLQLVYSYDGGEEVVVTREEKEALIIGRPRQVRAEVPRPVQVTTEGKVYDIVDGPVNEVMDVRAIPGEKYCPYCGRLLRLTPDECFPVHAETAHAELRDVNPVSCRGSGNKYINNPSYRLIDTKSGAYVPVEVAPVSDPPRTAAALNDYLIRRFSISAYRLRAPMPIELPNFHRNDLAQLFAELGFKRGAEIGVAEGNYSEVILKANPECELLLVDPWHRYSENPQNKSKEKHEFAYSETLRKTKPYPNVSIVKDYSMNAVRDVNYGELDWVYLDGQHQFDFIISDLIEWSKRVRSGGIVSGDDYYALDQKRWVGGGVVEAVQAYTKAHQIPIWWLCAGHRSVDYFWVKP